jgi:hypothetical protein
MKRRISCLLRVFAIVSGLLLVPNAIAFVTVETQCKAELPTDIIRMDRFNIDDQKYYRAEGDSYLTYPEWYIVYAYIDLADVTRQSSESSFDYIQSIRGFWTSLCGARRTASAIGPVTRDQVITDYIIGVSFTAEMSIQGGYERTIGALSAWLRGSNRTPEDIFASRMRDDYAAFLQQTPWYQFPFGAELSRFWRDVPLVGGNPVRKVERRVGLTLELGVKALYARIMGYAAAYSPAELTILSIVEGLDASDLATDPRIEKIRDLGEGVTLIQTPRYQQYTEIIRGLGARGRRVIEIAGNTRILTTVLVPNSIELDVGTAREIFAAPIQSREGWRRVGLDTHVGDLAAQIGAVERQGGEFEHAYDY